MKFRLKRKKHRVRKRFEWRNAQRFALAALMVALLMRLGWLTYDSWDVLELDGPRRRLAVVWGLGLIALALLLRFFRFTFRERKPSKSK